MPFLSWRKWRVGLTGDDPQAAATVVQQTVNNTIVESKEVNQASTITIGVSRLATTAEVNLGSSDVIAVTPDGLAGSNYGEVPIGVLVEAGSTELGTGDAKNGNFFRIPSTCNGWDIVAVAAKVWTAGTTGTTDIQLRNVTDSVDVLSTKLTIDSGETDSLIAATPAVINTSNDSVATGDCFTWDVDAVQTTAPYGLYCEVILRHP